MEEDGTTSHYRLVHRLLTQGAALERKEVVALEILTCLMDSKGRVKSGEVSQSSCVSPSVKTCTSSHGNQQTVLLLLFVQIGNELSKLDAARSRQKKLIEENIQLRLRYNCVGNLIQIRKNPYLHFRATIQNQMNKETKLLSKKILTLPNNRHCDKNHAVKKHPFKVTISEPNSKLLARLIEQQE